MRLARQRPERKPVVDVTVETMWDYTYQAKHPENGPILASDSLTKLKAAVRERHWPMAWLTAREGMLSYGQNGVHEYPYVPYYFC